MRDPMPTAAQAHVLLYLLRDLSGYTGHVIGDGRGEVLDLLWHRCWIDGDDAITALGRDALYRYLTRTFTGAVEVVEEQPIMFHGEAGAMLRMLAAGGLPDGVPSHSFIMHQWADLQGLTPAGHEALISYLLRDFNA